MNKLTFTLSTIALSCLAANAAQPAARGVDRANLDPSVAPSQDFYDYACGGWMKANPLKAEYSRFGTFDQLAELNRQQVHELITELAAQQNAPGTNAQKIADLYNLGMDSVRRNDLAMKPVMTDIAKINAAGRDDLVDLMATLPGVDAFFGTGVSADMRNADINVVYWEQGGLGLGDRDYYLDNDERAQSVREAYVTCIEQLAQMAGYTPDQAKTLAHNTLTVETELARAAMSREELRDPLASYNPMTISDLANQYKNVDLKRYFAAQGIDNIENLIVGQPKSLAAVDSIFANADIQMLRDYMTAGYLMSAANFLDDKAADAKFQLTKVLSGVEQQQPRWKRALAIPNGMLGEALGELYVAKYFPPTSKEKMMTLVNNLKTSLGQHIAALPWMTDETKAKAQEKLAAFTVKIGYPDKWRDYSKLVVDPEKSYWENVQGAIAFNQDFNNSDFGKPVDKSRWYMSPQTVNAYYNPTTNEICFPAGILQAPYFNPEADDAENYGAIGVVIGHEMTHGFDDQGRQFDKDGNLADWWTAADAEAFKKLADGLAAQFDSVEVAPGVHANGRFTLGENIADQGGLRVAHTAYHNALNGSDGEVIDGFTPDQRFYLAYANVWAGNIREAEILSRTKTDPHSLGRWRVNASLRNIEPFFAAFDIAEGSGKMWRPVDERVIIW